MQSSILFESFLYKMGVQRFFKVSTILAILSLACADILDSEGETPADPCAKLGGKFDDHCRECIGKVESGFTALPCSSNTNAGCGYYRFNKAYFDTCNSFRAQTESTYEACAADQICATSCVEAYVESHYQRCTGTLTPMCCKPAAFIHRSSKYCMTTLNKIWNPVFMTQYFEKIAACLGQRRGGHL